MALSDAQALQQFITGGDPAAFEAILQRHGPMVLRVCRRLLDDPNDVDDAFQATFLILVKKAASIRDREVLATWLYGVARRVAVRARVNARRRQSRERPSAEGIAMAKAQAERTEVMELASLLDDEMGRLPLRFRGPLILCDLEGQTHEQAAAQLGCPVGTVKSRLSRGRERLRLRLIRRGVTPAAATGAIGAGETASAVPVELINLTVRAATALTAGRTITAGAFSAQVAALMEGALHSMVYGKLKVAAGAAAAIALAVAGFETLVMTAPTQGARAVAQAPAPAKGRTAVGMKLAKPPRTAEPGSERFELANGLTAILRPIEGVKSIALVVLYSIGGDHDPEGKSGLAHMVEHVYATAAAGDQKARTAEEFAGRYPEGTNGQTGDRYTVFSTVFPEKELDTELKDAAARMGDLRVTAADLERERPRLLEEIDNMFAAFPALAAMNNARELVRPTPGGGRRGGIPAHVKNITVQDIQAFYTRFYKPRNAIVALSGAVDPAAVRERITADFGRLPSGENIPAPRDGEGPRRGEIREIKVRSPAGDVQPIACVAYAAPPPDNELYAPFLVLVARLWAAGAKLGGDGPTGSPVYFTPMDDGAVVAISAVVRPGETSAQASRRIEAFVAETIEPRLQPFELMTARQQFGFLLGLVKLSDNLLANNPYGVAFALGRREQLAMAPAELRRAWDAITDDQLRRVAQEVFAPDRHAGASIAAEK
jgi:zinc protease